MFVEWLIEAYYLRTSIHTIVTYSALYYSSEVCSVTVSGTILEVLRDSMLEVRKELDDRIHDCLNVGLVMDRDYC